MSIWAACDLYVHTKIHACIHACTHTHTHTHTRMHMHTHTHTTHTHHTHVRTRVRTHTPYTHTTHAHTHTHTHTHTTRTHTHNLSPHTGSDLLHKRMATNSMNQNMPTMIMTPQTGWYYTMDIQPSPINHNTSLPPPSSPRRA